MSRCRMLAGLLPVWILLAVGVRAAESDLPPAASWIPARAFAALEIARPRELLDAALQDRVLDFVRATPEFLEQRDQKEMRQIVNLVKYFEQQHNSDWRTLLKRLVGGGMTLAVGPEEAVWLIVDSEDEKLLRDIHEFFLAIARNEAVERGQPDRVVSSEYRGVTGWKFGPEGVHAIIGRRLVISNKPENLMALVDLKEGVGGDSLAAVESYAAAQQQVPATAAARLYLNTAVVKQVPKVDAALRTNLNPMAALLFGPWISAIRDSNWLTLDLTHEQPARLRLRMATDGVTVDPDSPGGFASPQAAGSGPLPVPAVPQQIAAFSLYRDLHRFYAAKDELFPERSSGLIFFENMMGIFFTGRNLTDEVLAEIQPEVRLVVAEQQFSSEIGTPRVQVPAFAAVFRMRDPRKFAPIAEEAWQKALGLVNFTRGQQAQPGLIIDRPTHNGTKYTLAFFSAAEEQDRANLDIRFNFQPVLAMPGEYLVLSSSEGLARDLVDALKQEAEQQPARLAGVHTQGRLEGPRLQSILQANRETLIAQNMVEKGTTREEAERQVGALFSISQAVRNLQLSSGQENGLPITTLELDVQLP